MDISDIRLEQFEAWEHVHIPTLSSGLNVIHLDAGARAIDFSRFLHGVLCGFEEKLGQTSAGSLSFVRADGQHDSTEYRLSRHARRDGQRATVRGAGSEDDDVVHHSSKRAEYRD